MIELTVNLTDDAHQALTAAAEQTGDSKTDTVSRALTVYARIIQAHDSGFGTGRIVLGAAPGGPCLLVVNPRPQRRWWWSR